MKTKLRAAALLFTHDGQLVLVGGNHHDWYWNPGGGIEENEPLSTALERELREELSLEPDQYEARYLELLVWTFTRDDGPNKGEEVELTNHYYVVRLKPGVELKPNNEVTKFLYTSPAAVIAGKANVPSTYVHIHGALTKAQEMIEDWAEEEE
jgi:8-oxo-dGTP pyrophosphatase MutT (NUDIX family)